MKLKNLLLTTFIVTAVFQIVFLFSATVVRAETISNIGAAREFCSTLPNGQSNIQFNYCSFTRQGSTEPCVVSSQGSFPAFSETCETLNLSALVGRDDADVRREHSLGGTADSGSSELNAWLNRGINTLAALVGLVVVGSIIAGGIQYASAGGNSSQVGAAKNRITMAVLALILFMFGYTFLQWLIPGGIFN